MAPARMISRASPNWASEMPTVMPTLMPAVMAGSLRIQTMDQLQQFMQHHVYAVWDFTLLLKALQQQLSSTAHPQAVALIAELVSEEERDWLPARCGGPCQLSHFEIYLLAMEEIGADTAAIRAVVALAAREGLAVALAHPAIPAPSRRFMASTQAVIRSGQTHLLAAAFCYGREQLVPALFRQLQDQLKAADLQAPTLAWYLDRHIDLDGNQHGPLAERMVLDLCRDNPTAQGEVMALRPRVEQERALFWWGIGKSLR
jgi:hypothetical protein